MALPIVALNPMKGGAVLIDLSDIFMTDFAQLNLGMLDRNRSSWTKVKGFPNNMELEVEATFSGGGGGAGSHRAPATASRTTVGITVVIHYSLMKTPDFGYRPRDGRRPGRPLPERDQGLRQSPTRTPISSG